MILSSFEDAVKTYDLTWRIREASEASTRELHGSSQGPVTADGLPSSFENTTTATARANWSCRGGERREGTDGERKRRSREARVRRER